MKEVVLRISEHVEDAEILIHDELKNTEYFKGIALDEVVKILDSMVHKNVSVDYFKDMLIVDNDLIAITPACIIAKQDGHKRIVTYAEKAYKINFPNSIYLIKHYAGRIKGIEAYCYKEFNGLDTKLYRYAMPNMVSGDRICMGTAPKEIEVSKYKDALERVIFTKYTHAKPDNVKKFTTTSEYFEYLSKNEFPYDLIYSSGKTLKEVLKK